MMSLVWPVSALGFLLSMAQEAMTAADRIAEILDAENPIADGTRELTDVRGELLLEHVSFRFPDADADVLHDVNLHLRPGETLAVVGATGAGKSILTNLVPRLWDVTGGRITLDGVDVRELACGSCGRWWRPPSRTRRCSRCRPGRTSPSVGRTRATPTSPRRSRWRRRSSSTTCPSAWRPVSVSRA